MHPVYMINIHAKYTDFDENHINMYRFISLMRTQRGGRHYLQCSVSPYGKPHVLKDLSMWFGYSTLRKLAKNLDKHRGQIC
jgi:hypothetical protein